MTPSDDLMDKLLLKGSAESAFTALNQSGYRVSIHKLHSRLSALIAAGKRQPIAQKDRAKLTAHTGEVPRGSSLEGSENLLRAQIRAGQVFPGSMAKWEARHGRVQVPA